ncbi:hypothetical protein [uncultured Campylobacter sp.]|nr:hypothetical protein [uncultured Campylobacter sp.]
MKFLDRLGVDRSSFIDLFSACLGCGRKGARGGLEADRKGQAPVCGF